MATNIEKKITKSLVFGAGVEWLNSIDPDTVMGVRSISVGGEEQSVEITAGMLAEKLAHEIEQLGKKNSPNKPSPVQEANKQMSEELYENMEAGKPYTVTDLTKTISPAIGLNISKVRPWLTRLMEDGRVERTVVKGKPVFTKVG